MSAVKGASVSPLRSTANYVLMLLSFPQEIWCSLNWSGSPTMDLSVEEPLKGLSCTAREGTS